MQLSSGSIYFLLAAKSSTTFGQRPLILKAYFNEDPMLNYLSTTVYCIQVQCSKLAAIVYKISATEASPVVIVNLGSNLQLSGEIKASNLIFDVK